MIRKRKKREHKCIVVLSLFQHGKIASYFLCLASCVETDRKINVAVLGKLNNVGPSSSRGLDISQLENNVAARLVVHVEFFRCVKGQKKGPDKNRIERNFTGL